MNTSSKRRRTILLLAANPKHSTPLRLDEEIKKIGQGLERSKHRQRFQLVERWAVTPRDLQRSIQDLEPQIVHFSGHGEGEDGLLLEDETGKAKLVGARALASLFRLFQDQVECVVLNACYSDVQAKAIAAHVPYVIGMNQAIGDNAAREFAIGFYDALAAGQSIEFAYRSGCVSIELAGIPEALTPVLIPRSASQAETEPNSAPLTEPSQPSQSPPPLVGWAKQRVPIPVSGGDDLGGKNPAMTDADELESPEGCVGLHSRLYVDRPPIESDCYATVLKPGALIRVKAPRQMGKTSLMQRILHQAAQQGQRTAYLNFQTADAEFLESIDLFLQWFCASITNELNLDDRLPEFWNGVLGSKNKCSNYFQRYLLPTIAEPLTLGLDEVDQVFQHLPIAQDFFGLLRAWHERGKDDPLWQKLRLVIVHSKEVYIPLNINQSPFNVGLPIELPELNPAQVRDLVQRHGLPWSNVEIEQLMGMVDGHPYLVRKALYELTRGSLTLAQFLQIAPTEEGLYGDHLRRHLLNVTADEPLEAAMRQVVAIDQPVRIESSLAFKLRSMGLVKLHRNDVLPLCNLYRLYFCDRLEVPS
ncbi:MAG: CHAT domain-containing protein [Cyanobacteria bacterium CRU_2_1]|nr:CHAT domain-containing protein [Cyanobacteria bacterium RU_5_0]NJR59695.1 CHAT domain-containing protein [Cyanobacteria bacterium CRU_2_1]